MSRLNTNRQICDDIIVTVQDQADILRPVVKTRERFEIMIESAVGVDGLGRKMRRDSLYNHIATEDDIVQTHRNVTGAMPGQMDHFERADVHVQRFVGKINGDGLVDGFRETVYAEELITRLFSEAGFGEEGSEAATDERKSGFVMRDGLQVQFMTSKLRVGQWLEFG